MPVSLLLAQGSYVALLLSVAALLSVLAVGFVVVWQVRKRLQGDDEVARFGGPLAELRQLHRQGQLTDEEYQQARDKLVARVHRAESAQQAKARREREVRGMDGGEEAAGFEPKPRGADADM